MKKLLLLSVLFICVNNLYSQVDYLSTANKEFQEKNKHKAIVYSLRVIEKTPDNPTALSIIQLSYHFLDRFEISNEYGNRILLLSQKKQLKNKKLIALVYYYQGLNYYVLKQKKEACSFFNLAALMGDLSILTTEQLKFVLDSCE